MSSTASVIGRDQVGGFQEMEGRMREQIQALQEQRAAAMMTEIVDLQRERDMAVGKLKRMEKSVAELQRENDALRATTGGGEAADRIVFLERALVEERLLTSDLRTKLKMKSGRGRLSLVASEREKSKSLTDLKAPQQDKPPSSSEDRPIGSTPQLYTTQEERKAPTVANGGTRPSPRQKRLSSPAFSLTGAGGSNSPRLAPSPGYSPTVIPRRYKLAATLCRDAGTQTDTTCVVTECGEQQTQSDQSNEGKRSDQSNKGKRSDQSNEGKRSDQSNEGKTTDHSNALPPNIVDALATAKADVLGIQREKELLEARVAALAQQQQRKSERENQTKKKSESLQMECSVLRDSLSDFSHWTRQKLQLMEDDLDIFRVVYSLHGSLSKESSFLEELKGKLRRSEERAAQLEATNRQLSHTLTEVKDKYYQSVAEVRLLRERLSLYNPSSSSPLPSPHYPLQHRHPSPLLPSTRHSHKTKHKETIATNIV